MLVPLELVGRQIILCRGFRPQTPAPHCLRPGSCGGRNGVPVLCFYLFRPQTPAPLYLRQHNRPRISGILPHPISFSPGVARPVVEARGPYAGRVLCSSLSGPDRCPWGCRHRAVVFLLVSCFILPLESGSTVYSRQSGKNTENLGKARMGAG